MRGSDQSRQPMLQTVSSLFFLVTDLLAWFPQLSTNFNIFKKGALHASHSFATGSKQKGVSKKTIIDTLVAPCLIYTDSSLVVN